MNFKLFIAFVFLNFLSLSQQELPYVSVIDEDTVIVFSFEQGIELSKRNEDLKTYIELYNLSVKEIAYKDSLIVVYLNKNNDCNNIVQFKEKIITEKDNIIDVLETQKSILEDEVTKQKTQKKIAIGGIVLLVISALVF